MLKRGKEQESSANISDKNNFDDSDSSSVGVVLYMNSNNIKNSWILDSGATFHMCLHRHWFSTYKQMSGTVYMRDDSSLSVAGTDNIRLKSLMISSQLSNVGMFRWREI